MKVATPCLTEQQIDELRLDQLSREEIFRIETHVGACPRCQSLLDNSVADVHEWGNLRESLAQEPVIENVSTSRFASEEEASDSSSLDQILKMLGPTDDPRMLGRIGPYEIVGVLGQGGMGVVFKGYESSLNRYVAIKLLLPHLAMTGAARKRFAREAQAAAAVVDDHVMAIHGVAEWQGVPYLVMPFTRGVTLQKRLTEQGPFELREILRIGMQAAAGLAAAHAQGLVHRDVKPANMLLAEGVERVTLVDFGLARTIDDASLTQTGFLAGTPQYMSPEQARSEPVDTRSDLFSLGSVLYAICTGRAPFRAETSYGVLRLIADSDPTPIRELNPDVPDWLCRIVERLMAKQPAERYSSAAEVSKLLSGCLAHVQNPDSSPLPKEAVALLPKEPGSLPRNSFFGKVRTQMTRILISVVGVVGMMVAVCFQSSSTDKQLAALQGEWKLVAMEQEGQTKPRDELFNERLIIDNGSFSQRQTAPDGTEIQGESGRVSLLESNAAAGIDFRMWEGTAHGIYKLQGDELVLCVTREGGPRPDSLKTSAGDLRVLKTYRRTRQPSSHDLNTVEDHTDRVSVNDSKRTWTSAWIEKVSAEVPDSVNREGAQQWLREHEFQEIETGDITRTLMKKIHPGVDQPPIDRDGIRYYVRGVLRSNRAEAVGAAIEAFYLFSEAEKLLALHVGPFVSDSLHQPIGAATGDADASGIIAPSRNRLPDDTVDVDRSADRLPTVNEWKWETGEPELRQYPASDAAPGARIDPDMEARRFTGTWRIVSRSTAGIEQRADIGQTVQIRHRRMGEVCLAPDPNQNPRTVDIVYRDGPDRGKVLKGIYEWNPKDVKPAAGVLHVLRICTFIEPHPESPNARPMDFEAGPDVDTAIWECLSDELPAAVPPDNPAAKERIDGEPERIVPVDSDSTPITEPRPSHRKREGVQP